MFFQKALCFQNSEWFWNTMAEKLSNNYYNTEQKARPVPTGPRRV